MINKVILLLFIITSTSLGQQKFTELIDLLHSETDSVNKAAMISNYLSRNKIPVVEEMSIYFIYRGNAKIAAAPGELNGWNIDKSLMQKIDGTNLFFRVDTLDAAGRAEYKIWVDSVWMLDPLNQRKALGGFGFNSDVWMPQYSLSTEIEFDDGIPHGKIDTIWFASKILKRTHPVLIYQPFTKLMKNLATIYVNDGGEYLSIGKMNNVLDNLIANNVTRPVIGVFIDPRTDPANPESNMRMVDYSASEDYLKFLTDELIPFVEKNYPVSTEASDRLIIGASMGGLISTFASYSRPDVFKNSAAQSPAYMQANISVIEMIAEGGYKNINVYIDTGILYDTKIVSRIAKALLVERKIKLNYTEYPEGHNWTNWQARLDDILKYFFGKEIKK
ncbi:MAG: alpha/beta hydrolase-fold protein [Bacteroidota bacterium]|nr:alpha/beta hydrolase-fold protein [Bacteroidota bacterium]